VIQIHTTREVDGYQRMERLDGLTLAPGESVVLAPGGIHLMLLGLERMPGAGESVRLCLQLADGAEACAEAEVRGATEAVPDQHHHSEGQYHE
jgi:copper(I)-binding protein